MSLKGRDRPNSLRSGICWDLFLCFLGTLNLVLQMGDTVGPRYTAPKISAISYLFRTFSLLIMGDTERPRYTGFRGLSVRGITALQCIPIILLFLWPGIKNTHIPIVFGCITSKQF